MDELLKSILKNIFGEDVNGPISKAFIDGEVKTISDVMLMSEEDAGEF